ncbi:hypothetical protein [Coleofasciculus sp. G2-EDA-02]|uniref:hypothetical protein n=1 Tax=Coleofasciculus sp. G2-EDA-02 TaxID=3069529 RepID=UPI0032FCD641
MQELLGAAGGSWRVIDEVFDSTVVLQQDNLSCAPACGEMLLKEWGKIVEFPVNVGDFYTPEAAMERQRDFCQRERV